MSGRNDRVRPGLQLDHGWWRYLPAREWLQLLARQELRLVSNGADGRPLVVSSVDLLGNVSLSIDREAWNGLRPEERSRLVRDHGAELEKAMGALGGEAASVEALVRALRLAIWAVLLVLGVVSIAAVRHVLVVSAAVAVAGTLLGAAARMLVARQLRKLTRRYLAPLSAA